MTELYLIIFKICKIEILIQIENVNEFHNLKDKNAQKLYICDIAWSWIKSSLTFYFIINYTKLIALKYFKTDIAWTFSYSCKQFKNVIVDFNYLRSVFCLSYKQCNAILHRLIQITWKGINFNIKCTELRVNRVS